MSGFLRMMPSPEQGTSAITRSKLSRNSSLQLLPSSTSVRIQVRPSRATPAWISFSLWGWMSQETTSPLSPMAMAAAKDLPPGAAQASSTRIPGRGSAAVTASLAAASWM